MILALAAGAGAVSFCAQSASAANSYTWLNTGASWNLAADWGSALATTYPGAVTNDIAAFVGPATTNPNISSSVSLGLVNFSSATTSGYDITSSSPSVTLQLNSISAIAASNTSGTNTIDAPIVLGIATGNQSFGQFTGGTLTINGLVSSTNSTTGLDLTGVIVGGVTAGGTIELTNANTFSGGASIGFSSGPVTVLVSQLGNAGSPGGLGTGSIAIGFGTNQVDTLGYIGAGETSNRVFILTGAGTTPIETIDTTGETGALVLTSNISATVAATTRTLQFISNSNYGDTMSGGISNGSDTTLSFKKYGTGSWTLNGTNTYTGGTQIAQGNLILDFANQTGTSSVINSSGSLIFGSASQAVSDTLTLKGAPGKSNTQTLGSPNNFVGASHLNLTAGTGGSLALTLGVFPGSAGGNAAGATLDINPATNTSVTLGTASGTSGLFQSAITFAGNDFATNGGVATNPVTALPASSYSDATAISTSLGTPLDVSATTVSITGTATGVPSVRFNQNAADTISVGTGKVMQLGQVAGNANGAAAVILVSSNVGANTSTISGGSILANWTTGGKTLNLIQNNAAGTLEIDSAILNDASTAEALSKSGPGTAFLTGANTYTGITYINEGVLQFQKEASLYNGTTASWTAANINVANGAAIGLNVGGTGGFTAADVGTIALLGTATLGLQNGSTLALDTTNAGTFIYSSAIANPNAGANAIGLTKIGTGVLNLSSASTYSGPTTVVGGNLLVTNTSGSGLGSGPVAVSGGTSATLSGTGSVSGLVTVTIGSRIAPGTNGTTPAGASNANFGTPGTLILGSLALVNANLDYDLASTTTVGSNVNDLISTGTLSLSNVTLTINGTSLTTGTPYVLIHYGSTAATDASAFKNTIFAGGLSGYMAAYSLDTTNDNVDVTFSAVAAPEPASLSILVVGGLAIARRRRRQSAQ